MINYVTRLNGMDIIKDSSMTIDSGERCWKRVRSPSRAKRRAKRGFRQNIDVIWIPDPDVKIIDNRLIIGHPAIIQNMVAKLRDLPEPSGGTRGYADRPPPLW